MIFTFYSFKGGVGRSMAMANIAWDLASRGLRVLAIDFDLEAPGLERYFQVPVANVHANEGVINLIAAFKHSLRDEDMGAAEFRDIERFIHRGVADFGRGRLDLMPAGRRATDDDKRAYALAVRTFDWQDFYFNWEGQAFFEWLRKRLVGGGQPLYDVVLADSRTGVTEMGGVCACQLADVVVMLSAPNHQNIEGTRELAADLRSDAVQGLRGARAPLQIVVVPARVEQSTPGLLADFEKRFSDAFDRLRPDLHVQLGIRAVDLALPYVPQFAFEEQVTSERAHPEATLGPQYRKLCDSLLALCQTAPSPALAEAARIAVAGLRPSDPGRKQSAPVGPVFDPTKRWAGVDAYLSCANDARAEVQDLLAYLESQGGALRTEFSQGDGYGTERDLPASTQEVLRHARTVVLFADARGVRPWQRAEVALARSLSPAPHLVQVLLPGAADDAFELAFGASLADSDVIDLRRWKEDSSALSLLLDTLMVRTGAAKAAPASKAAATDPAADANPFPGPEPYAEGLAAYFFRREEACRALLRMVSTQARSTLSGPSGAGKTSLVLAGLFPRLRAEKGFSELHYLDLRGPGAESLEQLARFPSLPKTTLLVLDHVDECEPAVLALVGPAWRSDAEVTLLLVWREAPLAAAERTALERWKLEGARAGGEPRHRLHHESDWGPSAGELLESVVSRPRQMLAPLAADDLRGAVEQALARTGRRGEAGLIERVFADAGSDPKAATIQRAMAFLWNKQATGFLQNQAYNEAGGIDGLVREALTRPRSPEGDIPELLYRLLAFGPLRWSRFVTPASLARTAAVPALQLAREGLAVVRRIDGDATIELAHRPRELSLTHMPGSNAAVQPVVDDIVRAYNDWADGGSGDEADRHLRHALGEQPVLHLSHGERAFAQQRRVEVLRVRRQVKLGFAILGGLFLAGGTVGYLWAVAQSERTAVEAARVQVQEARVQLQAVAQQAPAAQTAQAPASAAPVAPARVKLTVYALRGGAEEEPALRSLLATRLPGNVEIEKVQHANDTNVCGEVRFFSNEDADIAKEIVATLNRAMQARGDLRTLEVGDRRGGPAGDTRPRGALELWMPPVAVPPAQVARWGESRLVQGGCATVGSDRQGRATLSKGLGTPEYDWYEFELPVSRPWVDAFFIGRTEVTAAAFALYQRECEQKRGRECPDWRPRFLDPQREPSRPAAFVSWAQARDYCAWAGGRLPTDVEWEKAARGPEGRFWPWGFDPDDRLFQGKTRNPRAPVAVGSYSPQGDSPYGVADMSGNVWEYTASAWLSDQKAHTIRGGSYLNTLMEARGSVRWSSSHEEVGAEYLGFRCVMDIRR